VKMTTATLAAVLACLPSRVLAQCPPSQELNPCELALFEAATALDGSVKTCEVRLVACEDKLKIRTSTVIREIVKPCPPPPPPRFQGWEMLAIAASGGLAVGVLLGALVR